MRRPRRGMTFVAGLTATAVGTALVAGLVRRRVGRLRFERGLATAQLAVRGGMRYAGSAPRLFAAAGERREQLRNDLAMRTADDVLATLGTMKGVMVKLGQMAELVPFSFRYQLLQPLIQTVLFIFALRESMNDDCTSARGSIAPTRPRQSHRMQSIA